MATLKQTTSLPIELRLTRFGDTVNENPQTNIPCYFEGSVLLPINFRTPIVLAVVINGTVHAVTQTIQDGELGNHWSAMVPEWAFHLGKNDVRFFVVTGSEWELTPCVAVAEKPDRDNPSDDKAQQ